MAFLVEQKAAEVLARLHPHGAGVVFRVWSRVVQWRVGHHPRREKRQKANKDNSVDKWLAMIDQLGEIHGWSHYERAYFMQINLAGAARAWFNRLDDYNLSWEGVSQAEQLRCVLGGDDGADQALKEDKNSGLYRH